MEILDFAKISSFRDHFDDEEWELLENYAQFYWDLMHRKVPLSDEGRRHFYHVCQGLGVPKNSHERVWVKYLGIRNNSGVERLKVQFEGKIYFKEKNGWRGSDNVIPPREVIHKLNGMIREKLLLEVEEAPPNPKVLLAKAEEEISANYDIAEKYVRRAIKLGARDGGTYSKLCAILRSMKKPEQALSDTEYARKSGNDALLTCRAAAMCDLQMHEKARKELAPVLARGSSDSKNYALLVVKRIKKEAPHVYEKDEDPY